MWPTTFNFEFQDVKRFDYTELERLLPSLEEWQHQIMLRHIIPCINNILQDCAEEARSMKVTELSTLFYYGKYPCFKSEERLFYVASIISYLLVKGFQIPSKTIDKDYFFLKIQW